jgi:hypothetical protein
MADRKLELSPLLRAIDKRDSDWLSKQPDDARKEFSPVVIQRFVATVDDGPESAVMLWMVNERVNVHLFDLHKHPDLTYRLLASCGLGVLLNHKWLAGPKRKALSNKAYEFLEAHYPDASDSQLEFVMSQHTKKSFSVFLSDCGVQPGDAKDILKAYDKIKQG